MILKHSFKIFHNIKSISSVTNFYVPIFLYFIVSNFLFPYKSPLSLIGKISEYKKTAREYKNHIGLSESGGMKMSNWTKNARWVD